MKLIIPVIILVFVFSLSFSGQCITVSYLSPPPTLISLERCSGSASPASNCTGIMRVKVRLSNGDQLLFWGVPTSDPFSAQVPGITWTAVK